jgi:hypothetical protein
MSLKIRQINNKDIRLLYNESKLTISSLNTLKSIFGYSLTELYLEQSTNKNKIQKYTIKINSKVSGFLSIDFSNPLSDPIAFQAIFQNIDTNIVLSAKALIHFLNKNVLTKSPVRFFTYIFPHETHIRNILENAGFELEGTLKKHIYTQGQYLDLLIMGTKRRVAL